MKPDGGKGLPVPVLGPSGFPHSSVVPATGPKRLDRSRASCTPRSVNFPVQMLGRAFRDIPVAHSPALGLDRSRASCTPRSVCIHAQIGGVRRDRKPLTAIELVIVPVGQAPGCVDAPESRGSRRADVVTGGRGHTTAGMQEVEQCRSNCRGIVPERPDRLRTGVWPTAAFEQEVHSSRSAGMRESEPFENQCH